MHTKQTGSVFALYHVLCTLLLGCSLLIRLVKSCTYVDFADKQTSGLSLIFINENIKYFGQLLPLFSVTNYKHIVSFREFNTFSNFLIFSLNSKECENNLRLELHITRYLKSIFAINYLGKTWLHFRFFNIYYIFNPYSSSIFLSLC